MTAIETALTGASDEGQIVRERPALTDSQIAAALREGYGLNIDRVTFLPVGNDSGAWSYRIAARDGCLLPGGPARRTRPPAWSCRCTCAC
jgi:hypothetical protein